MITAAEAKKQTEAVISDRLIGPYLKEIEKDIKAAIEQGKLSCRLHFVALAGIPLTEEVRLAVLGTLELLGYQTKFHLGCGDDPREGAWTEILW